MLPDYQAFMLPVLRCLNDGQERSAQTIREEVAQAANLTAQELGEKLPSGGNRVANRMHWACLHLLNAGLCARPRRGHYQITDEGRKVLKENPPKIDNEFLCRYESFRRFRFPESKKGQQPTPSDTDAIASANEKLSPQETLDQASGMLTAALKKEILGEIAKRPPAFFENLVVKLLRAMGYGGSLEDAEAGIVTGKSGDEGIDGIIKEDKLGFGKIYIQAKRWDAETTIGRPEIQKFVGALAGQGANKGLFVTTADFSAEARKYCQAQHTTKVVLINGDDLAQLMIDYNVGVAVEQVYEVKRIDADFFSEEE